MDMSETTEDNTFCCKCFEYNNAHRDVFKNKVLINRIHTCKLVDILTETQYIDMCEGTKNKQSYSKYMEIYR